MGLRVGPIELSIAAAGVGLVVAAVRNVTPLEVVRNALGATSAKPSPIYTAKPVAPTTVPGAAGATGPAAGPWSSWPAFGGDADANTGRGSLTPGSGLVTSQRAKLIQDRKLPPQLVAIPWQTNLRMDYEAVASLRRVAAQYGQNVYSSGTMRSESAANAGNAANPGRFAPGDKSAHVVGLALDLDGNRHNFDDPKLVEAFLANGWFRVGRSGPVHWSYGVPA